MLTKNSLNRIFAQNLAFIVIVVGVLYFVAYLIGMQDPLYMSGGIAVLVFATGGGIVALGREIIFHCLRIHNHHVTEKDRHTGRINNALDRLPIENVTNAKSHASQLKSLLGDVYNALNAGLKTKYLNGLLGEKGLFFKSVFTNKVDFDTDRTEGFLEMYRMSDYLNEKNPAPIATLRLVSYSNK